MQEANQYKDLPNTSEEDEAFKQMENIGLKEMFTDMGKDLGVNAFETPVFSIVPPQMGETPTSVTAEQAQEIVEHHFRQHAPAPQPTLEQILKTIGEQFALLATVINQTKAQPEPLQETIELLLKQSDWFKDMVRSAVEDAFDVEDYAKEAVEDVVESKVDSYFNSSFDASDHFDFHDAVSDCVSDQIQDAVSDKIDDAVEEYMSNATITIQRS